MAFLFAIGLFVPPALIILGIRKNRPAPALYASMMIIFSVGLIHDYGKFVTECFSM